MSRLLLLAGRNGCGKSMVLGHLVRRRRWAAGHLRDLYRDAIGEGAVDRYRDHVRRGRPVAYLEDMKACLDLFLSANRDMVLEGALHVAELDWLASRYDSLCVRVLFLYTSKQVRVGRLSRRESISEEEAEALLAASDAYREARGIDGLEAAAWETVENQGTEEHLLDLVDGLLARWR